MGIIQLLSQYSQTDEVAKLTSIVSESMPHLKKGAIRDFLDILKQHNYYREAAWNKSDFIYTFETGSKIEFFSADQPSKVKGPRRHRLFVNEANNISWEKFDQMEVRTSDLVFLDWNPTTEFWYYDKLKGREDVEELVLTYKDNEALSPSIRRSIEAHKGDKAWWQVYGLGLLGEIESLIFRGWRIIDEVPFEARYEDTGLDFGYSNHPSAAIDIYYHNGGYILDEILYQRGLDNESIAKTLEADGKGRLILADPAEPKSIDEIAKYLGDKSTIMGAVKGKGSILQGIQLVQKQKISVTKRSVNLIKEQRNYVWTTDKDGRIINVPIDLFNHGMDAVRYGFSRISPDQDFEAEQAERIRKRLQGVKTQTR